jgi:hypothetical protein
MVAAWRQDAGSAGCRNFFSASGFFHQAEAYVVHALQQLTDS